MAKFRINGRSLKRLIDGVKRRNANIQRQLVFALVMWADDTVGDIKSELIRIKAFDTGDLAGSVTRTAPKLQGKRLKITIFSNKEYATIIELGRRAKAGKPPPLEPIIGWANRKGITKSLPVNADLNGPLGKKLGAARVIRRNAKRKRSSRKQKQPLDQEVRDFLIVLAIQDAIWRKGIKGRKPFGTIWKKRKATFRRDIANMVNSGV